MSCSSSCGCQSRTTQTVATFGTRLKRQTLSKATECDRRRVSISPPKALPPSSIQIPGRFKSKLNAGPHIRAHNPENKEIEAFRSICPDRRDLLLVPQPGSISNPNSRQPMTTAAVGENDQDANRSEAAKCRKSKSSDQDVGSLDLGRETSLVSYRIEAR